MDNEELRERFDSGEDVFVVDNEGRTLVITAIHTQIDGEILFWGSDDSGSEKEIFTDCLIALI